MHEPWVSWFHAQFKIRCWKIKFNLTLFDFLPCCDSKNPLRYELNILPKCKQKSEPLPRQTLHLMELQVLLLTTLCRFTPRHFLHKNIFRCQGWWSLEPGIKCKISHFLTFSKHNKITEISVSPHMTNCRGNKMSADEEMGDSWAEQDREQVWVGMADGTGK